MVRGGKLALMRGTNIFKASVGALLLWPIVSEGRQIQPFLPEDMEPLSALLCNGTVLSVETTYPREVINDGIFGPEVVMVAKIKILHVFKGDAPEQIEFQYRVSDLPIPDRYMATLPTHPYLKEGERYRFFLNPGKTPGSYVGVLDAKTDDGYDVEKLCQAEADDSSYLKKDEAIKIARDYLHSKNLDATYDWEHLLISYNCDTAEWYVELPKFTGWSAGGARIAIRGDRTVDAVNTQFSK